MYIFGYKTTVSIQNLYILVKYFGKNFIFRVKNTNYLVFRDQMYIFGYKTTVFMQNLYILVKFFGKNFIFSVESTFFSFFLPQMYIFGYKTTLFMQNLYILVKSFGKNFIFSIKSKIFSIFQDQMFLGQDQMYILVKLFGIFGYKYFVFSGPNVHFWVQNYSFYAKFVHFSEIVWQKLHF